MIDIQRLRSKIALLCLKTDQEIHLIKSAQERGLLKHDIVFSESGEAARKFLMKSGEFHDSQDPDLIILDWNPPGIPGKDILLSIKTDARLKKIPVVILASEDSTENIRDAYNLHANCFIKKPRDDQAFIELISSIEHFWFEVVRLP